MTGDDARSGPRENGARRGFRVGDEITAPQVVLIGAEGKSLGVVSRADALAAARSAGQCLVEVAPTSDPPVCRMMPPEECADRRRRGRGSLRNFPEPELRTVRFPANVSEADFRLKMRHGRAFLERGGALEIAVCGDRRAAGRLLERIAADLAPTAAADGEPMRVGEELIVHLRPRRTRGANVREQKQDTLGKEWHTCRR